MPRRTLICLLGTLLLLASGSSTWAKDPDVYVRNVRVERPFVYQGGDIYVPLSAMLSLMRDAVKEATVDASGCIRVNGSLTTLKPLPRDGQSWFPLFGIARQLGWEVMPQPAVGIIDVVSPTKVRIENARQAEVPVDALEQELSDKVTEKIVRALKGVCEEPKMVERLERIGYRIAAASGRPNIKWRFQVLNARLINAVSVGGGRVFVTRGLMEAFDDDELAGAVAHEIAHVSLYHSGRAKDAVDTYAYYMRKAAEARQKQLSLGTFDSGSLDYQAAVNEEKEYLEKAHQLEHRLQRWETDEEWDEEREADRMGMIYAYNAGYSPLAMIHCLEKLRQLPDEDDKDSPDIEGASTHPPLTQRIELAKKVYDSYFRYLPPRGR